MTTHAVLLQNRVAATNVDTYNRSAIAGSAVDIDNGNVFRLDSQSTTSGQTECWAVTAPTTSGSTMNQLWMAASPEIVSVFSGTLEYRGLNVDPRNFYNKGGRAFDAFKPQVGDVITLTADALTGTAESTYACSGSSVYTLYWTNSQVSNALAFRYLATTYISLAEGNIDDQRITAYKFECIAN